LATLAAPLPPPAPRGPGLAPLPFLFRDNDRAGAAIDSGLGRFLTKRIEEKTNFRVLGYFENGFRQISNSVRPVRTPADLAGVRIRVLPSKVQARTFELLGAKPMVMGLSEALAALKAGSVRAQEKPLANTVASGG